MSRKRDLRRKRGAVARMQSFEGETAKICDGLVHPLRFRPDEMKPADNIDYLCLAADLSCILRDITDPRVRAARNNNIRANPGRSG